MKKIKLLILIGVVNCASLSYAEYKDIATLEDIRQTPQQSKKDIFNSAKDFFARKQLNAKQSEQIADLEIGKIIINGSIYQTYMIDRTNVQFKLILEIKEGKYRLTWENPFITQYNIDGRMVRNHSSSFWKTDAEQYTKNFQDFSEELFAHITTKKNDF